MYEQRETHPEEIAVLDPWTVLSGMNASSHTLVCSARNFMSSDPFHEFFAPIWMRHVFAKQTYVLSSVCLRIMQILAEISISFKSAGPNQTGPRRYSIHKFKMLLAACLHNYAAMGTHTEPGLEPARAGVHRLHYWVRTRMALQSFSHPPYPYRLYCCQASV